MKNEMVNYKYYPLKNRGGELIFLPNIVIEFTLYIIIITYTRA